MDTLHTLIQDTLDYAKHFEPDSIFLTSANIANHYPPQTPAIKEKAQVLPSVTKSQTLPKQPTPEKKVVPTASSDVMRDTLSKLIPGLKLTNAVPDDKKAKQSSNAWREKLSGVAFVLLALSQDQETLELLKSLAKAIDARFGKTKIMAGARLEAEDQWELFLSANTLRLVIISAPENNYPRLMQLVQKEEQTGSFSIQDTPLLVLENTESYKQIAHKANLWKSICQHA